MQLVPWKKTKATQRTVIITLVVCILVQNVVFFFSLRNKFRPESTRQQGTSICEEQGNCALFADGIFNANIVTHENTAVVVDNNHSQHAPGGSGQREPHSSHVFSNKNTTTAVSNNARIQCVSQVADILYGNPQVFIFMAAKAGGTSLKDFAIECSGGDPNARAHRQHHRDNFINNRKFYRSFLLKSVEVPKIVASHLYTNQPMIDLIRYGGAGQNSVIFYMYRDETDRLLSAIRHVIKTQICGVGRGTRNAVAKRNQLLGVQLNNQSCTFNEEPFVDLIKAGYQEIGFNGPILLTCDLWQIIDEMAPRIVFVHYSQSDRLQAALSEQYCPHATTKRQNTANISQNLGKMEYLVQKEGQQKVPIALDDWLQAKGPTIEFALQLSEGSCKHKTRTLEDEMKNCPILQILPKEW